MAAKKKPEPAALVAAFAAESPSEVLQVQVVEAKDLIAADRGGTSDPFARATLLDARGNELKEEPIKTDVVKKTLAPYWGKEACWGAVASADAIAAASVRVQLFDKDTFSTSHDPLGELVLPLAEVLGEGARAVFQKILRAEHPSQSLMNPPP